MRKLLQFIRSLLGNERSPRAGLRPEEIPAVPSSASQVEATTSPYQAQLAPARAAPPPVRRPILLVGDDLGWLQSPITLAGRPGLVAGPSVDPVAMLAARTHEVFVAS